MSLEGKCVLITRPRDQADRFAQRLEESGATVLCLPFIRIRFLEVVWPTLDKFDLIIFSSQNAARAFFRNHGLSARTKVACIGEKTAEYVAQQAPDTKCIIPSDFHGEGLATAIKDAFGELKGLMVFAPQAEQARGRHLELLRKQGAEIESLTVYTIEKLVPEKALSESIDYVTFMSGRSLEAFVEAIENAKTYLSERRLVAIGPVTAQKARELGLAVDLISNHARFEDIIKVIQNDAGEKEAK